MALSALQQRRCSHLGASSVSAPPCSVSRPVLQRKAGLAVPNGRRLAAHATRRQVEPVPFPDVYMAMEERIMTSGFLSKMDGMIMMESVRTAEHGQKALALVAKHVSTKMEQGGEAALAGDWPTRKKWLERLIGSAAGIGKKDLIFEVFANQAAYGVSTYFAADVVELLGKKGVEAAALSRVAELNQMKRQPGDKGVKAAYARLLEVLEARKEDVAAKMARNALRSLASSSTTTNTTTSSSSS